MINEINLYINEILEEIIDFRRKIHANPELSCLEFQTSNFVRYKLEEHGIKSEIINNEVGVTALIEGGQPGCTVAYRADIDALPIEEKTALSFESKNLGCAHSCGHDIHTAVLLGTTLVLNKFKDQLKGNVRIIFQSGEENGTGAVSAVDSGVLDSPSVKYIVALHTWPDLPAGTIGLKKGSMMASNSTVNFKITGKGGHAAHPHRAIDPVIVSAYIMTAIQSIVARNVSPLDSAVITFGKLQAGTASNIIPDYAAAQGTVRTLRPDVDILIEEKIKDIINFQAQSFGAIGEVEYKKVFPPVINDEHIIDILEISSQNSIGGKNIRWLEQPSMGSEDFAYYLKKIPGALIRLGTNNESEKSKLPLHNPELIFDEKSIYTGIQFMSHAIFALLEDSNVKRSRTL
jgi:amidohydrolase